ncbi:hypothetical protein N9150_03130, partial [Akkermansiaceae bacterium]|nr:hypothetical protein [Akkermansiaceae bacterium]
MIKEIVTAKELGEAIEYKKHGSLFLWALTESLCSIETSETSVKVSFLTFGDLYWQPSEGWALHGIDFEGEPPQVTRSLRSVPELEAMVFSHISGVEDIGSGFTATVRYYLRLLNELIDKRLNQCRDGTTSFSIFDLGILVIDDGHMSFTPYSTSAADNPSQYARAIKLDAWDGFTIAKGRFFSDLSADTCSLLLKKVSSRIRKKQGGVVGLDTRPFCLPPNVNFLDEEALSVLAGHRGCLDMSSIHKLDTAGARSLSAYEGCSYVEVRSNP